MNLNGGKESNELSAVDDLNSRFMISAENDQQEDSCCEVYFLIPFLEQVYTFAHFQPVYRIKKPFWVSEVRKLRRFVYILWREIENVESFNLVFFFRWYM